MADTKEQFEKVISQCRELFEKKLKDYGPRGESCVRSR